MEIGHFYIAPLAHPAGGGLRGAGRSPMLCYQGFAVANYSFTPECLANERIRLVKNSGGSGFLMKNLY